MSILGGGGGGISSSQLEWDCVPNFFTGGITRYFANSGLVNSELVMKPIVQAGTIDRLYIQLSGNIAGGETLVITIRLNGAPTTLTATVGGGASTATDLVNSFAVVAGDYVTAQGVSSNIGGWTNRYCSIAVRFTPA